MRAADGAALARRALAGAAVTALGAFAHVAAGGRVAVAPLAVVTLVAAVAALAIGSVVRWTFWRALAVTVLAQPALHAVLGVEGGHGPHHGAHHSGGGSLAEHATEASTPSTMWLAHAGVALAVAVLVRWGTRWVRTMPELLRAVAYAVRRLRVVVAAPRRAAPVTPTLARGRLAAFAWDSRGPPR